MSDMLVGCERPCVVSVGGGGLVVMGGRGDGDSRLADVQVFDGKTQTWHFGPSLPKHRRPEGGAQGALAPPLPRLWRPLPPTSNP